MSSSNESSYLQRDRIHNIEHLLLAQLLLIVPGEQRQEVASRMELHDEVKAVVVLEGVLQTRQPGTRRSRHDVALLFVEGHVRLREGVILAQDFESEHFS